MSTARWGKKWADVDEEEDDDTGFQAGESKFSTQADEHGIKTVIAYTERDGHTYRVTKKVKQTKNIKWTNEAMVRRKTMAKFGKAATNTEAEEKMLCVRSVEEIHIELSRKQTVNLAAVDDVEAKFHEESLTVVESLMKEKKVWKGAAKDGEDGPVGVGEEEKKGDAPGPTGGARAAADGAAGKYVPPSLRDGGKGGGKDGKGKGKGDGVEASLRVFNLSEDAKEGDLQDLFGQCGRLSRVYLAKDPDTFLSKGFAFITYYNREDAQKAIDKLNGHGYDNLIMKVEWAKPRA
eukprot:TRINITY_DN64467_c0_g1_i1.p1 TRINITY_DN64467_c0_g1~~TRINITY_DN64467_c0_g1_i1.p1  ORF type:complete len:292 (+),score=98.28 TRINITY_DN64467_c0_g1_i1:73-948(+)